MRPVLFEIHFSSWAFQIGSYRFFGILAALLLTITVIFYLKKYLSVAKALTITLLIAFSFVAGSRLLYAIINWPDIIANPAQLVELKLRNFAMYGGLALGLVSWWLSASRYRLPFWRLTDKFAVFTGVALAVMRLGCFFNGCCFGLPTEMPWGVTFPRASQAHIAQISGNPFGLFSSVQAVHPAQLYEMGAALLASLIAWKIMQSRTGRSEKAGRPGLATAVFGLVLSGGRLIIYFFRNLPADNAASLMRGPGIYGAAMLVFASWIAVSLREAADK